MFLALDGPDGTGKTTQCQRLADWLRECGREVVLTKDPGGTEVGEQLREVLLGQRHPLAVECEALLYMASRAQLVAKVIEPALSAGKVVVCDRFLLANVVYQGHAGGLDPEALWQVGRLCTGGRSPDVTLVLDMPAAEASARRKRPADRVESRSADYQERVRRGFQYEARRRPERMRVVDAGAPVAVVQEAIRQEVCGVLGLSR